MDIGAYFYNLLTLSRWQKRAIMLGADVVLLSLAVWVSFALRLGSWQPTLNDGLWLVIVAPLLTIPLFITLGLYRAVICFIGGQVLVALVQGITASTALLGLFTFFFEWEGIPRSIYPIYW